MIKTESAYEKALERLVKDKEYIQQQREALEKIGLTLEQINHALQPSVTFYEQLKEEVIYYEKIRSGDFEPMINLNNIGKSLIAYRIYLGLSQQKLAERLNVSASQISRDERNEYYGATIERIREVMESMHMVARTQINPGDILVVE